MDKNATKPKQARVYFNDENAVILEELAKRLPDFSEAQIVTLLVSASLRAVKANGYRLSLPLKLEVVDDGPLVFRDKAVRK